MATLDIELFSGGGGRPVKSNSRQTVEFGLARALSTCIPDRPKFRLGKTFTLLGAAALFYGAAFALAQPVKADDAFTVAGINSTLPAWSQAAKTQESNQPQQIADDSAFSKLTSFAQQIGAGTKTAQSSDRRFDDQTFAALRDFAQRVGSSQPESIKAQPKLAEADTLMDWLAGKGSTPGPHGTPSPGRGGKGYQGPAGRSPFHRLAGLPDLPCDPDRAIQNYADGQDQLDATGKRQV